MVPTLTSATIKRCGKLSVILFSGVLVLSACDQGGQGHTELSAPRDFIADAARGKGLYDAHCASCHGVRARGGTKQGPPLVHKYYEPSHHGDASFHLAVRRGVKQHHWYFGDMQPVKDASPENVADIVDYVRQEQRRAGIN